MRPAHRSCPSSIAPSRVCSVCTSCAPVSVAFGIYSSSFQEHTQPRRLVDEARTLHRGHREFFHQRLSSDHDFVRTLGNQPAASCSCGCRPSAQTRRCHLQLHGRKASRSLAKASGAPPAGNRRAQCVPARFDPSCVQTLIISGFCIILWVKFDETLILMHSPVVHLAVTLTVLYSNRTIRRHARRARGTRGSTYSIFAIFYISWT